MVTTRKYGTKSQGKKGKYAKKMPYKSGSKLVALIKKVSLGTQETKHVIRNLLSFSPILHNSYNRVVSNLLYTEQGVQDSGIAFDNRIGDSITPVGVKLYLQFSQPVDRPNVTFRLTVVKFHGSAAPPLTIPVTGISGNNLLDPIDTEKCSVVKVFNFKAKENYWAGTSGTSKQITNFMTLWIPLPKKAYVYGSDGNTQGKMFQLSVGVAAYDTFGTLGTDVIGYISLQSQLYFKDA